MQRTTAEFRLFDCTEGRPCQRLGPVDHHGREAKESTKVAGERRTTDVRGVKPSGWMPDDCRPRRVSPPLSVHGARGVPPALIFSALDDVPPVTHALPNKWRTGPG